MKTGTMIRCLLTLLIVSLSGIASAAADTAAVYKAKCAICHGPSGEGDTPMWKKLAVKSLGSAEVQKMSDAEMLALLIKGKNKMPGFDKKLTPDELKALVAHVRTFARK